MNKLDSSKKHLSETRIIDNPHNLKSLLIKGNGKHKTKNISICSNPIFNCLDSNHTEQEEFKMLDIIFSSSFIDDTFEKLKKLLFEKEPASKRLSKLLLIKDDFIGCLKAEIEKSLKILKGEDTYSAIELSSQRKALNSSETVNFNVFNKRKAAPHPLIFVNTSKKELNLSNLISKPSNREDNLNRFSIEGKLCSREAPSLEQYISKAPKKINSNLNNSTVKGCSLINKVIIKKKASHTNNTTNFGERSCSSREGYSSKLTNRSKDIFSKCNTVVSTTKQKTKVLKSIGNSFEISAHKSPDQSLDRLRAIIQTNLASSSTIKNSVEPINKLKDRIEHFKNSSGVSLERFLSGNITEKQRDIIIKKRAEAKPALQASSPCLPDDLVHKKTGSCQNGSKPSKVFLEFGLINRKTKSKVKSLISENSLKIANVHDVMNKVKLNLEQNYTQHLNFSYNDFYLNSKHQTLNSSRIED